MACRFCYFLILIVVALLCGILVALHSQLPAGSKGLNDFKELDNSCYKRCDRKEDISTSVRKELMELEQEMHTQQKQIDSLRLQKNKLLDELKRIHQKVNEAKGALEDIEIFKEDIQIYKEKNTPTLKQPLRLTASTKDNFLAKPFKEHQNCTMSTCFDLARCPLSSGFPIYFYNQSYQNGFGFQTVNPEEACLFVVEYHSTMDLENLPYWKGDGRNHLVITDETNLTKIGKAMVASSQSFDYQRHRNGFDVLLPKALECKHDLDPLLPLNRKFLLSYQSTFEPKEIKNVIKVLKHNINHDDTNDRVKIDFNCQTDCDSYEFRHEILSRSTFALILSTSKPSDINQRLYEALQSGSIPVFLCFQDCSSIVLPFDEVIDWKRVALFISAPRITELHFIMKSFQDPDLFEFKRQGRKIWQHYMRSTEAIHKTMVNLIRTRIDLPASPMVDEPSDVIKSVVHQHNLAMPSETFTRNLSSLYQSNKIWNDRFIEAFHLPPYNPYAPKLPTDARYLGSELGFEQDGIHIHEQFTGVILTCQREEILIESLRRLSGFRYLNKVIVVWNCQEPPPNPDLTWPDIGVPIKVIKTKQNSLNNRFLPYDLIETEAILSLDDDIRLTHHEILYGFEVWRENKHRLVGYPAKFHSWNEQTWKWNYNSTLSCEASMVLTGAAFYHKYYSYAYSQYMSQSIRDKVDELMNCEDIAMNFLIADMTRQAPIKLTKRYSFRCKDCPSTLSNDSMHYEERTHCINAFTKIYGYNPLIYTQIRAAPLLSQGNRYQCYTSKFL